MPRMTQQCVSHLLFVRFGSSAIPVASSGDGAKAILGIDNLLEIGSKFVLALVERFIIKDEADFTVLLFFELGDEPKNVAEVEIFAPSLDVVDTDNCAADGQVPDRPEAADMALNDRQLLEHAERLFRDAFGDGKRVGTKCLKAWFDADPCCGDGVLKNSVFEFVEAVVAEQGYVGVMLKANRLAGLSVLQVAIPCEGLADAPRTGNAKDGGLCIGEKPFDLGFDERQ